MQKSESIKELATALNKVQNTLQAAKKGSENPYFHSKYADLLAVWDACRETLTSNGLSVVQVADMDEQGRAYLETMLLHTSGEWIKGRLPLLSVKQDPQAQGSAITYARRYSLSAIVGLCTEGDDDAEGAMGRDKKVKKTTSKPTPKAEVNSDNPYAHLLDSCPEHGDNWRVNEKEGKTWRSHMMPDKSWCNFSDQVKPILKQNANKAGLHSNEAFTEWVKGKYGRPWSKLTEEEQVGALWALEQTAPKNRIPMVEAAKEMGAQVVGPEE